MISFCRLSYITQNVHAIGDRANGLVLNAFEASLKGVNVTALRPRLEHAQMMTKADMKRLGKLGGVPAFLIILHAPSSDRLLKSLQVSSQLMRA